MSETAIDFGVVFFCIALCIMMLSIFFSILSRINSYFAKPNSMAIRGFMKKGTWATVHMAGSETFNRVRFIGFTDTESLKTHLPYELNGMVILEDADQKRFFVRAKAIRMIVIDPAENSIKNTSS